MLGATFPAAGARADDGDGTLVVDGQEVSVRWNDGDSFQFRGGPHRRRRARLVSVNTLEDYGPVHRWGAWTPAELLELARRPVDVVTAKPWRCTTSGRPDGYGRLLVTCPELARELVRTGLAMVFAVDAPAPKDLVSVQRAAQRARRGMWRKGVPPAIPTGAHSVLEGKGYDRVVDTRSGEARAVPHERAYETCQQTCVGEGRDQACLVYVPFKRRYRDPPPCLRLTPPAR